MGNEDSHEICTITRLLQIYCHEQSVLFNDSKGGEKVKKGGKRGRWKKREKGGGGSGVWKQRVKVGGRKREVEETGERGCVEG